MCEKVSPPLGTVYLLSYIAFDSLFMYKYL